MKKILCILLTPFLLFASPEREADSLALIAFRDANPQAKIKSSSKDSLLWSDNVSIHKWHGITVQNDRVTSISLEHPMFGSEDEKITVFPPEIGALNALEKIDLVRHKIKEIPSEIGQLVNLKILRVGSSDIVSLPEEFTSLFAIEEINLSFAKFETFPLEITKCTTLKKLDILGVDISILPDEITKLTNLEELNLKQVEITEGFENIWKLMSLKRLYIKSKKDFPLIGIGNLINLEEFDFQCKNGEIPKEIGSLVNLKSLLSWNNKIPSIPVEIVNCTKLERLYLPANDIIEIPEEVYTLTNLIELTLYGNKINHISPGIGQLTELESIRLWGNEINELPKEIGVLSQLRTLDIHANNLLEYGFSFEKLQNLKSLNLSDNAFTTLPPEICTMDSLAYLNISENKFQKLPDDIYHVSPTKGLYVGYNYLHDENLSSQVIYWLDRNQSRWRDTQYDITPVIKDSQANVIAPILVQSNAIQIQTELSKLSIYTPSGRVLYEKSQRVGDVVPLSDFSPGVYVISIVNEEVQSNFSLTVTR